MDEQREAPIRRHRLRHAPMDRADRRRRRVNVAVLCVFGTAFVALGLSGGETHPLTSASASAVAARAEADGPRAGRSSVPHEGADLQVTPSSAGTGDLVIVSGATFDPASTVVFGDVEAEVQAITPTRIAAVVPADLDAFVDVVVHDDEGDTTGVMTDFEFTDPTPSVTGVVPPTGPKAGGQVVQITGTNLYQYTLKQPELAIKTLQAAIGNLPDNQDLGVLLGIAYEQTGDTANAKEAFQSVLDQNPENPAAQAGMARLGS